jgi:hypothetical protein
MQLTNWNDLHHKASSEARAKVRAEAALELEHVGFAALRKAAKP